jgi:hypothetical protein
MIMKGLGAALTDPRSNACTSLLSCSRRVTSGSGGPPVPLLFKIPAPFPWGEICLLGIANLLLPVVDVNRETLQVVSLAMTGLMRDGGRDFHNRSGLKVPKSQDFKVARFQLLRFPKAVSEYSPSCRFAGPDPCSGTTGSKTLKP